MIVLLSLALALPVPGERFIYEGAGECVEITALSRGPGDAPYAWVKSVADPRRVYHVSVMELKAGCTK